MATAGRGVRKATKLGGASEQDSAQSDTPQGPVDRISLVAQVTGWAPEECASVLEDYDGDEQAAISAIIEGTADAFKKVENKRTKPVEKPSKAPSYHKSSSDKSSRPPRADKNGDHTDTQRDGKPDRRRSANPRGDRPRKPFGNENGARPPAAKEDHTAPQPSGETAQPPTQSPVHPVNTTNPPSQPTAPTQTPTASSNAAPAPVGSADTSNTTVNKAPGSKPQRAWDQTRTWGAAPRSSSPSNPPRERNIPPRQQNQHTQNQTATPQPSTETQSPTPTAAPEKAPAQSQAPAKPAQPTTAPSAAAVPTTQPKTPSPAPAAAPSPAAAAPTAPTQQTQPQQPQQAQAAQPAQSGSRYSSPRQTKPGQTTTTWKPKDTQPKAPSPQGGASQAAAQATPAPAAVAPPQKPAAAQPVQPAPQVQAVAPATHVHQAQAPAVSQARHTPVVLPPTADVTAANIHLQFGSISGLGSVPEVNKGVVDYESQQRYGSGAIGGSGQLGGEVYQDPHSVGVENDLGMQQPHVAPFPYHFGVGMPLQGLPPQHYQPSFDPNDPEHLMPGMLQYYDPSFQYQHPRDPADPKFPNRNSGSYGPRDANKFGQDAASAQAQPQPQQQGQQQQQSGQSPVQQHYMPVGQYGAGPMYYPYSYGPYQQPQYPPHFQRMLYKQPYGFPNANPGYPGPSSTLGGYDENYKGSVYGAQMPPFMFPESNVPKAPSSQQAGLSTSPPKSAFSAGGAGSAGNASDITSGAFKSQAGDYKGYQNAGNNPQSFYNLAPAQSQFNQQQPISFGTPHNMLQQPQQPYQQQTRTSQQQY